MSLYFSEKSEVAPNLWMGGVPSKVTNEFVGVVSLYPWETYYVAPGVDQLEYPMYDSSAQLVDRSVMNYITDWINVRRLLGPVLVHCQAGLNRSGLVTAYTLMRDGLTANDAIETLRTKRSPHVLCNRSFEKWLREQEGVSHDR